MSLKPDIIIAKNSEDWASLAVETVSEAICSVVEKRGLCHLMLAGGDTVKPFYEKWASWPTMPFKYTRFLFGDERCVPPNHPESNYFMVMRTLLAYRKPSECSIERMVAESPDRELAAREYEKLLPNQIDILLLGVGADGHIASLFPGSSALLSKERRVVSVTGPKAPCRRLTITPRVIASARSVFVLATGEKKGKVLAKALREPKDFMLLPVCLTLGGIWLLDGEAGRQCLNRNEA